ncbi:hypothetical protein [Vineibacter terrae]|uniref:hypothetical protein n=1 Tax=Vineibacter terrae TaxID=2586908 RepID=UPI002E325CBD|nr:hypothetical protein [Vineibacter terrae]HEX2886123.1 hypothetical protein [Vineibacter terrae]
MPDALDRDLSVADLMVRIGYQLLAGVQAFWFGGPTQNPNEALAIVDDAARLRAARAYWTGTLAPWIADLSQLDAAPPPALTFSAAASDPDVIGTDAGRRGLHAEPMPDILLQDLGCMVALDEVAAFTAQLATFPGQTLLSLMRQVLQGQTASLTREVQAIGLQAARQVHELVRRFDYVTRLSMLPARHTVSFTELLALYRMEGNCCCAPPELSFPHGPLTLTRTGTCRTPDVIRDRGAAAADKSASRPGWLLVISASLLTTGADEDFRLKLAQENLNWIGGLDALTTWSLQPGDELREIAEGDFRSNSARAASLTRRSRLAVVNRPTYDRLLETLWMSALETQDSLPALGPSLDAAYAELNELMRLHKARAEPTAANPERLFLLSDDYGNATFAALKAAARWYRSRLNPLTLLAWRDRAADPTVPRFGPFTAYLRYHLGDVLFMGCVIRVLKDLLRLRSKWEAEPAASGWRSAIPDASWLPALLDNAGWTQGTASAHAAALQAADRFWSQDAVYYNPPGTGFDPTLPAGELIWRTVGVQQAWRAAGGVPPWFPPIAAPDAVALQAADTVNTVMTIIRDNGLVPALDAALEYSLQRQVFSLPAMQGHSNLKKSFAVAENFRRLQLYLEAARDHAGLDINGA